jgi:hypothetical protein
MAMIKGKNQHVMPDGSGWCVIDEASQMFTQHFDTQEEAITHATQCAKACEGEVLIHMTHCAPSELSTVALPQREMLPEEAHAVLNSTSHPGQAADVQERNVPRGGGKGKSDFDPLLGYDEYYFEI